MPNVDSVASAEVGRLASASPAGEGGGQGHYCCAVSLPDE